MFDTLLPTKLYLPPLRPDWVPRPRLLARLEIQPQTRLIFISAPAGYGKTTLVTAWLRQIEAAGSAHVGWLALDEEDSDPQQFFRYLAAAVRPLPGVQAALPQLLQTNQAMPARALLKAFVQDVTAVASPFILVLDDYHAIDSAEVDGALAALLDLMPPQMTLVLTSRSDPGFPLSRLRARGQLVELRAAELRFTAAEAAQFLGQTMGLSLSPEQIAALESRTEGWIAGLQMAALSMQNRAGGELDDFVHSFTGSHRFVLDYLVEEVLHRQAAAVQTFLLRTSILDRLCGPLCDAVVGSESHSGQEILESLERANLFLVPLDNERRWYRYHHLFADLLRQRLQQSLALPAGPGEPEKRKAMAELHTRASVWYEENGLEIEAFHHAAAANDVARATRLVEGGGMPLHFQGVVTPVLNWLESLPETAFDAQPSLWVTYASVLLFVGQNAAVEPKLQAAEAAIANAASPAGGEPHAETRDLIGRIAAMRATMAIVHNDLEVVVAHARRALAHLRPDNVPFRTAAAWTLGYAHQSRGDRAAAGRAFTEIIAIGESSKGAIYTIAALTSLGQIQEADTRLSLAAGSYRRVLQVAGDPPQPVACEAHLGLARLHYQWNDLAAAQEHGQKCLQLLGQIESVDTFVSYELFLARLRLAQGDVPGATAALQEAEAFVRRRNLLFRLPDIAAAQALVLLRQGELAAAAELVLAHELPFGQARVYLAQGDPAAALAVLEPVRRQVEERGWHDERLQALLLQALACGAQGKTGAALERVRAALALARPGGFIRLFVDEGAPLARLLYEALVRGIEPAYVRRLLAAFPVAEAAPAPAPLQGAETELVEPLSERELEVLQLIAEGLTNQEVANRLFLSLHTVKVHARNIYGKLGVKNRTQAVAQARALGLLSPI